MGTDIESTADVGRAVRTFGSRYVDRLFTAHEIDSSGGRETLSIPSLTARFAAKEAFFKVLRTPDVIPPWKAVEVVRRDGGWTELRLAPEAAAMAEQAGITQLTVSLSHVTQFGLATVVAVVESPLAATSGRLTSERKAVPR